MKESTIYKFIDELTKIKKSGMSIPEYCKSQGKKATSIYERVKNLKKTLEIDDALFQRAMTIYESIKNKVDIPKLEEIPDFEDFSESDGLAGVTIVRSTTRFLDEEPDKGVIIGYKVEVKVRDSKDFTAALTREDAEAIFGLYTYYGGNITARNVANEFPKYTLSDIKKIFRAFKLTKDSIWCPPHLLEELSEEQLAQYRMNIKERAAFKYADSRQERDFKNSLNKMASKVNELQNFKQIIKDVLLSSKLPEPLIFPTVESNNSDTLILFMADMHIGAKVTAQAIYENNYDLNEVLVRIGSIVKHLKTLGTFKKVVVVNVGDALDGMDNQTARRDHFMPQNMGNQEQIDGFVTSIMCLFEEMMQNEIASEYSFKSVYCGNHDGAAGYAAALVAAAKLHALYPQIETEVSDTFFLRHDEGEFTYFICHGKDDQFMRRGLPMNLDANNEVLLTQYINSQPDVKKYVNVVSGDLHNEAMNRGKSFKYWKVGSFFGSSDYCMLGFGNTPAHINYHIIKDTALLNGTIELQ